MLDLAVIGGGAAGFFAAINTKIRNPGFRITIFEKSSTLLGKVRISGGGRCNVTHACFQNADLVNFYPRGSRELRSVFEQFNPSDTIRWFKKEGIELHTEADGRMFPVSNNSETIVDSFFQACKRLNIKIETESPLLELRKRENFILNISDREIEARNTMIAGGSSKQLWKLMEMLGHTIIDPVPSLFTFKISDRYLHDLQGLSVPNAKVGILYDEAAGKFKRKDLIQSGPLLITHWGLSGPAILKLSSVAARYLHAVNYNFEIQVNIVGKERNEVLEMLFNLRKQNPKKGINFQEIFPVPKRWWQRICEITFNQAELNWADLSNESIHLLADTITSRKFKVSGKSTFKDEFVTAGGIDLKEVDFKTMQSKKCEGLYFAGEILDIDALTGGFNFQAAWSGAWIVSQSVK